MMDIPHHEEGDRREHRVARPLEAIGETRELGDAARGKLSAGAGRERRSKLA
jgi:hypothetical protein